MHPFRQQDLDLYINILHFYGDVKEKQGIFMKLVPVLLCYVTTNANTRLSNVSTFHSSPPGTSFLEKCTSIKARATCCFSAANKPKL